MPGARRIPRPTHLQCERRLPGMLLEAPSGTFIVITRSTSSRRARSRKKGRLDIVGECAVLGIGDGLQPAHTLRVMRDVTATWRSAWQWPFRGGAAADLLACGSPRAGAVSLARTTSGHSPGSKGSPRTME